jgi:hypothetical protein
MWKVGDVEPVRVMGAEGYPYGFHRRACWSPSRNGNLCDGKHQVAGKPTHRCANFSRATRRGFFRGRAPRNQLWY